MLDRLYDLSDFWVFLIFAGCAVGGFGLAPLVGNRLGWTAPDKDRAEFAIRALTTIASFTAVLLSFSLVQVNGNLRQAGALVDREASQVDLLDRQLQRYGGPQASALRLELRAYVGSIVEDEWPAFRNGRESAKTTQLSRAFIRGVLALDPAPGRQTATDDALQKTLDGVIDLRAQRLTAAELKLPSMFWYLILTLVLMMVGLSTMIEPSAIHAISIASTGVAIALLAALVFTIDTPFMGENSVAPSPFAKTLAGMAARD